MLSEHTTTLFPTVTSCDQSGGHAKLTALQIYVFYFCHFFLYIKDFVIRCNRQEKGIEFDFSLILFLPLRC